MPDRGPWGVILPSHIEVLNLIEVTSAEKDELPIIYGIGPRHLQILDTPEMKIGGSQVQLSLRIQTETPCF